MPDDETIEKVEQLAALIPKMNARDQSFANDLVSKGRHYGLSTKQRYWVGELIKRASMSSDAAVAPRVDNFAGVIALFQTAAGNLKYPKIRLRTKDGHTVCLGVCGERSRYAGAINLTDGEGFHEATFWGRIERTGAVTLSAHGEGIRATLTELLQRLSSEPAKTAAEYGKLTGQCTFCNRPLDDAKSTAVGYGPSCAKNFNLPWGVTAAAQAAQRKLV